MVIIPNIGAALHTISNAYNNYLVQKMESIMTDFSGYTIIVNPPSYFNAITAGGVLELLFLVCIYVNILTWLTPPIKSTY